jgi:hypothetical protein
MAAVVTGVASHSGAYQKMMPLWAMINCLLGGTGDMRAAGKAYLPQYPGESDENYKNRRSRAVLYAAYSETSKKMTNKPFSKPLAVTDINPAIKDFVDDVDLQGNDLHKFARNLFGDALDHGFSAVLADFPVVDPMMVQTKADEEEMGARPYFIHVKAENIIAAYSEIVGGVERLTHVRIKECMVVRDGFEERMEETIRVLEPGSVTVWKKNKDKWEQGKTTKTRLTYIPMVIYYTDRESLCCAKPPLLDLAYKNIEHWQGASDQNNCLTVARFPILAASGVSAEEGKKIIGPRSLLKTADAAGKFYYVEHSGAAIEAGKKDLDNLKDEMTMMGIQPLVRKAGGAETATKTGNDAKAQLSDLEAMVIDLEDALEEALEMMLDWATPSGKKDGEAGEVVIFKDFAIDANEIKDLDFLFKVRNAREISREAFINEIKRRSVLADTYDPEKDKELLDQEAPAMPTPAPSKGAAGAPEVPQGPGKAKPGEVLPADKSKAPVKGE